MAIALRRLRQGCLLALMALAPPSSAVAPLPTSRTFPVPIQLPPFTVTAQPAVTEGQTLRFLVALRDQAVRPVTFAYRFSDASGVLADGSAGTLIIAQGQRFGAITRRTRDDNLVNGERKVTLHVRPAPVSVEARAATLERQATATIRDNDRVAPPPVQPPPVVVPPAVPPRVVTVVTIANAGMIKEGQIMSFPLRLSPAADQPVTVSYRLIDQTRTLASPPSDSVTLAARQGAGRIAVRTRDNRLVNPGRAIRVELLRAANARIGEPRFAGGIVADAGIPPSPEPSDPPTTNPTPAQDPTGATETPIPTPSEEPTGATETPSPTTSADPSETPDQPSPSDTGTASPPPTASPTGSSSGDRADPPEPRSGIPLWPFVVLGALAALAAAAYAAIRLLLRAECAARIAPEGAELAAASAIAMPEISLKATARPGSPEILELSGLVAKETKA